MNDYLYFAFLDVIGYKSYLQNDISTNSLNFKDKLQDAFQVFNEINAAHFHHKSISDSIFLNCTAENPIDFLKLLKKIFVSFAHKGILIRGGVSYNRHFENQNITYSLALTEAYNLESSEAIFPRILIHQSIIDKLRNDHVNGSNILPNIVAENLLLKDGGVTQLHVVDEDNWGDLYSACKKIYEESSVLVDARSDLRLKHVWLQNYLFNFKPKGSRKNRYIAELTPFSI